jgi:DNA-binding transcriptional ArsR family regulator
MADIDVFYALSNPTCRQIMEMLRAGPRSVNRLGASVSVTQPAVSQHLKVLRDALLVQVRREGNQRIYSLNPKGLQALRQYVEAFWDEALVAYQQTADLNAKEVWMVERIEAGGKLEPVRKSIKVKLAIEDAFTLFTDGITSWWPLETHSVGEEKTNKCVFEGKEGGRIYEVQADGTEAEWGRVKTWDPPEKVIFTWHPDRQEATAQDVEVTFTATTEGTELQLVHRDWELLGDRGADMREGYDSGWDIVLGHYIDRVNN